MNKVNIKKQQNFFDNPDNQYSQCLILNPPNHTVYEMDVIIQKIKKTNSQKVILDFGAGSGRVTIPLLRKGFTVLAVDISHKSLKQIQDIAQRLKLKALQTTNSLPKDKKFKTIVGADVLHHIDIDEYFPIIYDALNKGGHIIFSEPGAWNVAWYICLPIASSWSIEKGITQCTCFNLKNKLKKYGFRHIKISGLGLLPRPLLNWSKKLCRLNDMLGNMPFLKSFAYRYIIEATK